MEYRTKSAEVLNSSDDFERKLSWILFKQEQEVILYQTTQKSTWVPGIPLRNRPVRILNFDAQYIRPMFEIMDTFHNNDPVFKPEMCCRSCEVYWNDYSSKLDECWMCGGPSDDPRRGRVGRSMFYSPNYSYDRRSNELLSERLMDRIIYDEIYLRPEVLDLQPVMMHNEPVIPPDTMRRWFARVMGEDAIISDYWSMFRGLYQSADALQPDVEIAVEEPPSTEECDVPVARPFEINASVASEFAIEELEVTNVELDIPDEIPERLPRSQSIRIIQETDPIRFRTRLTFEVPITEQRRRRDL